MIAGGIGITPLLSMGHRLRELGAKVTLHYCTKSPAETAFAEEVKAVFAHDVVFHHDGGDPSRGIDLAKVLADPPEGAAGMRAANPLPRPPVLFLASTVMPCLPPLRDRFGIVQRLEFYSSEDLEGIVHRSAGILNLPIEDDGAKAIATRSRGTPRIANRLLRRVRDFAEVKGDGVVTGTVSQEAMDVLQVDPHGFDALDRRLLRTIIEKFDGGPVGIESIAAAIGEERGTIEDVLEPYLIQQGFMMRTARGRVATKNAYLHFGLRPPTSSATQDLPFDSE